MTITKQEHIQLKSDALRWQILHRKAVERSKWREERYQRILRDLQKRLFAKKTESHKGSEAKAQETTCRAHRGQRRGAPGHGRTMHANLFARHEFVALATPQCPRCGLGLRLLPGTEDAEVLEIEVKAYRRVIHRRRYLRTCQCAGISAIVTAAPPARLINRGKFGISVWTTVLLYKYLYGRPSARLLQDLSGHGLHVSAGTLAGGLQTLTPLFKPLDIALQAKLRTEPHWHADETRWAVFVDMDAKVGHRWYLWVFHSRSVVHYVLDSTRAAQVIQTELAGVDQGIISCDR